MKITFKRLRTFNSVAGMYIMLNPDAAATKLGYAIQKVLKKTADIFDDFNFEIDKIKIRHCFTDAKGVIEYDVVDKKQIYRFTPEKRIECIEAERKLKKEWDSIEFDFEPFLVDEMPEGLSVDQVEAFTGIVIHEKP